jgi:IS1 family transposase
VPADVRVTHTITHRDEHGTVLSVEIRAVAGEHMSDSGAVHIERVNGTLRDRLHALTRTPHALAKRDAMWDALVGFQIGDHHFCQAHQALRLL